MTYDTTLHELLDPPEAAVVGNAHSRRRVGLIRWLLGRRFFSVVLLATALLVALGSVTWVVGRLAANSWHSVVDETPQSITAPSRLPADVQFE